MDGRDSRRNWLWHLWAPVGLLFLAAVLWQQQAFETRKDCLNCGGTGMVPEWVRIPEEPEPPQVPCDACGPLSAARLQRWVGTVARQIPDTPLGLWAWFSTVSAVALILGLRLVRCRRCGDAEGPRESSCAACGDRRRLTLLDRWLAG